MKITNLNLDSFRRVSGIDTDEIIEGFYMNEMDIICVKYNRNTGIVSSFNVNGENIPLDDSKIIEQFNASLAEAIGSNSSKKHF